MKLFGLFLTSTLATNNGDRMFSDRPEFLTGKVHGWNKATAERKRAELESETDKYFTDFLTVPNTKNAFRARTKTVDNLQKLRVSIDKAFNECFSEDNDRKRRSTEDKTRWALPTAQGNRIAWNGLAWQYGNYIRQLIAPNGSRKCNRLSTVLYRRLDRFNFIWKWQACTKGFKDNNGISISLETDCEWAAVNKDGSQKKHPRKENYLQTAFGKDTEQQYRVVGCDDEMNPDYVSAAKLACPLGGTISVHRAQYGRENTGECSKNPSGTYKQCKNYTDVLNFAKSECDGKTECDLTVDSTIANDDPCPGIDKFTKVLYRCL